MAMATFPESEALCNECVEALCAFLTPGTSHHYYMLGPSTASKTESTYLSIIQEHDGHIAIMEAMKQHCMACSSEMHANGIDALRKMNWNAVATTHATGKQTWAFHRQQQESGKRRGVSLFPMHGE
jgi:hypothetical protein